MLNGSSHKSHTKYSFPGFFLEMLFWGRNSFRGERKCEKYPKNITKFVTVWGGGGGGGGGEFKT